MQVVHAQEPFPVALQRSLFLAGPTPREEGVPTWRREALSLLEELGGAVPFKAFAASVGFETGDWRDELGLSLGTGEVTPLEMARFVATVLDSGRQASGRPVVQAMDAGGALRVPAFDPRPQVLDTAAAALTRDLMRLVIEYGTGGAARSAAGRPGFGGPAIGKTGTTDSEKDLWFVGGTGHYSAALWVGYDQPERIGASASDLAAPLWGWWMRAVHQGLETAELPGRETVGRGVCTESGLYGNGSCRMIGAPFLDKNPSGGMHHVCYEVDDIHAALDRLVAEGARVLGDGEPKPGAHDKPVLFLHPKDFCGTLIELEQV